VVRLTCPRRLETSAPELIERRADWAVEADFQGFFAPLDPGWLMRGRRRNPRWASADDTGREASQGGPISSDLADVSLRPMLAVWFPYLGEAWRPGQGTLRRQTPDWARKGPGECPVRSPGHPGSRQPVSNPVDHRDGALPSLWGTAPSWGSGFSARR